MPGEKHLRPCAERHPLCPFILRITVLCALVNEDWHHSKLVVWLKDKLFRGKKLPRIIDIRRRVWDGCAVPGIAEVACRPGSVLDHEGVIAAMPLQPLMAKTECVPVGCRDGGQGRRARSCGRYYCASLGRGVIEPQTPQTERPLY